jgi:hypothetical protein
MGVANTKSKAANDAAAGILRQIERAGDSNTDRKKTPPLQLEFQKVNGRARSRQDAIDKKDSAKRAFLGQRGKKVLRPIKTPGDSHRPIELHQSDDDQEDKKVDEPPNVASAQNKKSYPPTFTATATATSSCNLAATITRREKSAVAEEPRAGKRSRAAIASRSLPPERRGPPRLSVTEPRVEEEQFVDSLNLKYSRSRSGLLRDSLSPTFMSPFPAASPAPSGTEPPLSLSAARKEAEEEEEEAKKVGMKKAEAEKADAERVSKEAEAAAKKKAEAEAEESDDETDTDSFQASNLTPRVSVCSDNEGWKLLEKMGCRFQGEYRLPETGPEKFPNLRDLAQYILDVSILVLNPYGKLTRSELATLHLWLKFAAVPYTGVLSDVTWTSDGIESILRKLGVERMRDNYYLQDQAHTLEDVVNLIRRTMDLNVIGLDKESSRGRRCRKAKEELRFRGRRCRKESPKVDAKEELRLHLWAAEADIPLPFFCEEDFCLENTSNGR